MLRIHIPCIKLIDPKLSAHTNIQELGTKVPSSQRVDANNLQRKLRLNLASVFMKKRVTSKKIVNRLKLTKLNVVTL